MVIHTSQVKKFLTASYDHKAKVPEGYSKDKSLSGKRAQVYKSNNSDDTIVTHRGTKGIHDMITDVKLVFGNKKTKRFKHGEKIQKQAEEKYGAHNVTTMGHSLGGKIAEDVGKKSKQIITVNKAATPLDIGKKIPKNQTDIRTKNDLVSKLSETQRGGKKITIKSDSKDALKEHGLDTLDRINQNV